MKQKKIISFNIPMNAAQIAIFMAILTFGSKVLGFLREMVMAGFFGAGYIVDAYIMALSIPSILFAGFFLSISTAYMPLLSEKVEKEGHIASNKFTTQIINFLLLMTIVTTFIGIIYSKQLVDFFASGFKNQTAELTVFFLRITLFYAVFSSIVGIFESFLQYKNKFIAPIIIGYAQNIIVLLGIVVSAFTSYYNLAYGMLFAYIIRISLLYIQSKRNGFVYNLERNSDSKEDIKKIIVLAIPVFIGSSINQINLFVDKTLASNLIEGSISALNYANLLNTMIMTTTASILATIIYPKLSKANSLNDHLQYNKALSTGFYLILIISVPFCLGAILYNQQIVQIVYERGAFDVKATMMTGGAYLYYSVGLVPLSLNELLLRAYYSKHDMKTPMIFAGICVIINITLSLLLVKVMAHNGLALATSIATFCNMFLLCNGLRHKEAASQLSISKTKIIKILMASIIAIVCSWLFYSTIVLQLQSVIYIRVIQLGITVIFAGLVYILMLIILKIDEIKILKNILKNRSSI